LDGETGDGKDGKTAPPVWEVHAKYKENLRSPAIGDAGCPVRK
jgi:hypothetical protein